MAATMNARPKKTLDDPTELEDLAFRLLSDGVPLTAEPDKESVARTPGISARPKKTLDDLLDDLRDALTEVADLAFRLLSNGVPLESVARTLGISARTASGLIRNAERRARGFLPNNNANVSTERTAHLLWWVTPPPYYLTGLAAVNLDDPAAVVSACRDFVYPQGGKNFLVTYPDEPRTDDGLPVAEFESVARFVQDVLHHLHEFGGLTWDQINQMNRHLEKVIPALQAVPTLPPSVESLPINEALAEARKRGGTVPIDRISEGVRFAADAPQIEEFTLGVVCTLREVIREESQGEKRVNRCEECGRLFILRRSDQRYCSDRCLSRAGTRRFRAKNSGVKVFWKGKPAHTR